MLWSKSQSQIPDSSQLSGGGVKADLLPDSILTPRIFLARFLSKPPTVCHRVLPMPCYRDQTLRHPKYLVAQPSCHPLNLVQIQNVLADLAPVCLLDLEVLGEGNHKVPRRIPLMNHLRIPSRKIVKSKLILQAVTSHVLAIF